MDAMQRGCLVIVVLKWVVCWFVSFPIYITCFVLHSPGAWDWARPKPWSHYITPLINESTKWCNRWTVRQPLRKRHGSAATTSKLPVSWFPQLVTACTKQLGLYLSRTILFVPTACLSCRIIRYSIECSISGHRSQLNGPECVQEYTVYVPRLTRLWLRVCGFCFIGKLLHPDSLVSVGTLPDMISLFLCAWCVVAKPCAIQKTWCGIHIRVSQDPAATIHM